MKKIVLLLVLSGEALVFGQRVETGFTLENVAFANSKFADVTPLEFGAKPLPRNFTIKEKLPAPIKQGENSCVAQAISYGLYSFVKGQDMSGHFTYRMCALQKTGSPASKVFNEDGSPTLGPELVFDSLKNHGTCKLQTYGPWRQPHPPAAIVEARQNRIDFIYQTISLDNIVTRIKRSLHENKRPVPFGMDVGDEFLDYKFQGDQQVGNTRLYTKVVTRIPDRGGWHFMLITGWNEDLKAFEVFNSFGNQFGDNGLIFITYELVRENIIIAYTPKTASEFGAEPKPELTKDSFNAGSAEGYCKLGIRKDRNGMFEEKLFNVTDEEIASGKITINQELTAQTDINVREAMPVRRSAGLILPKAISVIKRGEKVALIDYSAFQVNPPNVIGTQTHFWIKVRRVK